MKRSGNRLPQGVISVFVAALFSVAPSVIYGADYYACDCGLGSDAKCVPGSDASAGNSPLTPWKSFTKARQAFATLSPGDTISFCRGGTFTSDGGSWVNSRCMAGTPCTITSYVPSWGDGGEPRAVIKAPVGKSAFSFADGGNADHEEGYVVSHLEVRGSNGSIGFFIFNDVDDVVLEHLDINGHDVGVLVQSNNTPNAGSNGLNERITLQNSHITDNASQGFMGSCSDCSIVNNIFDNNGFRGGALYHNVYWDGAAKSTRSVIAGNTLTRSAMLAGKCQGASLVVHGIHSNLTIENNTVQEEVGTAGESCWGIAVDTAYSTAEGFTGLVIRGNTVKNMGNTAIGINACTDCLIEGNTIVQGQAFTTIGINIPDRARGPEDGILDRVTVRNNTITINNNAALQTGLVLGGEGYGHVSTGNSVTYTGTGTGWNCFSYPLTASAYSAIDNNVCRSTLAPAGRWEKANGTLGNWQTVSGFDLNSSQQ